MGAEKLRADEERSKREAEDFDIGIMGHRKKEEGEGPWLISYADLMTLLMGFFALISSMSTPDPDKIEKVKRITSEVFGGEYKEPYKDLGNSLRKFIEENSLQSKVQIQTSANGVELTFDGTLFFDSGEFVVKSGAEELMRKMAIAIKNEPRKYKTLIEGHTDSQPIGHPIVASNWELSGLRSARIAQIFERTGFPKQSLIIIGWGDVRPVKPNSDPDGKPNLENMAANRRVVIRVFDKSISRDPFSD